VAAVVVLVPALSWGAGFALFEHGNRGMAMGGAFTAVADDPSALFWNPAGLSFQTDKGIQTMGGFTLIKPIQTFYGEGPYPGVGYVTEQEDQIFYPMHFYLVMPINDKVSVGGGVFTPFGLGTWWDEDYAGRFLSKRADLKTFDLSVSASYKISDALAVSVGIDYLIAQIDLTRNIGFINPYTQQLADVGQVHMYTDDLSSDGFGWHGSFLADIGHGFKIGALYRSEIEVLFSGKGSFTQYATGYGDFDAMLADVIPFGSKVPLETEIDFPDFWVLGLSWSNDKWIFSGQYCAMGWKSFQELPVTFIEQPWLSSSVLEAYDDSNTYRFGMEYRINETWAVQAGYLFDETPQPPESMSPLLGDGDRTGYSFGLSFTHDKLWIDFGYMYLPMEDRGTEGRSFDGYNGSYDSKAHLLGFSLGMSF
jgi:long-chain fatty acid transport protein